MAIADRPPRPPPPTRANQDPPTIVDRIDRSLQPAPANVAPNAQSKRLPRGPERRAESRGKGREMIDPRDIQAVTRDTL
eukprot:10273250-Karenia_brevis.AAC.1